MSCLRHCCFLPATSLALFASYLVSACFIAFLFPLCTLRVLFKMAAFGLVVHSTSPLFWCVYTRGKSTTLPLGSLELLYISLPHRCFVSVIVWSSFFPSVCALLCVISIFNLCILSRTVMSFDRRILVLFLERQQPTFSRLKLVLGFVMCFACSPTNKLHVQVKTFAKLC